jgi:hypothetical protein
MPSLGRSADAFFCVYRSKETWVNLAQFLTMTKRKSGVDDGFSSLAVVPYNARVLSGIISSNLFVLVRCEPIPRDNLSRVVVEQYIRLRSLIHS